MKTKYHRAITAQALQDDFSPAALEQVIAANLGQDHWLRGQIGHDEYHFDRNAFRQGWSYIEINRAMIRPALEAGQPLQARQALGRLTHAAQDFYAHSNYIPRWLARFSEGSRPAPEQVDPFDRALLEDPGLRSGKLYYPLEVLSFIPALGKYVLPLLPRDSHAWMNLDDPGQGPGFDYAFAAAVKRTRAEFERSRDGFPADLLDLFLI
ncbi:MAG TPA: hypothetical protein VMC09_13000 [Anaerolineales bacterium]|nr:hypothetical protein [Anaerolineales bacterium]